MKLIDQQRSYVGIFKSISCKMNNIYYCHQKWILRGRINEYMSIPLLVSITACIVVIFNIILKRATTTNGDNAAMEYIISQKVNAFFGCVSEVFV